MPNLLAFEPAQFLGFVIILGRISGLIVSAPVLGDRTIPVQVKAGFAFILSLIFYPIVAAPQVGSDPNIVSVVLITISEVGVGLLIGFSARLLFTGIAMAGEVIGFQMGIGIANVFDPATSAQGAVVAQFVSILAMLMWLAVGAHHTFIRALAESFTLIPIGTPWSFAGWEVLDNAAASMFVLALKLVAPVLLLLFFVYVALGLISRAVPQIQVFFVSFPLTVGLGLLTLAFALPAFMSLVHDGFSTLDHDIPYFMRRLSGN